MRGARRYRIVRLENSHGHRLLRDQVGMQIFALWKCSFSEIAVLSPDPWRALMMLSSPQHHGLGTSLAKNRDYAATAVTRGTVEGANAQGGKSSQEKRG